MTPLRLNEFKTLYRVLRRGWPDWAAFLLLGLLVWVEGKVIKVRVETTVSEAIKEYETLQADAIGVALSPPTVVVPPPVYSETGTGFFDEMRLTAPWVVRDTPSDPP